MKFYELIEEDGDLLENFKKEVEVKRYCSAKEKVECAEKIRELYVDLDLMLSTYNSLEPLGRELDKNNELDAKGDKDKIKCIKIWNSFAIELNCYCGEVFEEDNINEKEYELIMSSGIYDYILEKCHNDYKQLTRLVDIEICNIYNSETIETVSGALTDSVNNINLDDMTKLKEQLIEVMELPNYKEIKDIADKIK